MACAVNTVFLRGFSGSLSLTFQNDILYIHTEVKNPVLYLQSYKLAVQRSVKERVETSQRGNAYSVGWGETLTHMRRQLMSPKIRRFLDSSAVVYMSFNHKC
ncbi:UNVERIFIED_CONTAM: hypothetical protein K2H54_031444 [Gekko kuhli]